MSKPITRRWNISAPRCAGDLIQPERTFPITQQVAALTPADFAHYAYGSPEEWAKETPPCYQMAYLRWSEGGISAWLRQRGLRQLAEQCDAVRERMKEYPYAAFETILRLLEPNLPPVKIAVDISEVASLRTIPHHTQRTYTLRYSTRGAGTPFGALLLESPAPGARLESHLLTTREGTIVVVIDARMDIIARRIHRAIFKLDSGFTQFAEPTGFNYRMIFPAEITLRRVLAGAGIGALICALPRVLLTVFGERRPVTIAGHDVAGLWDATNKGLFPFGELIIALLIMMTCVYLGLRIWFVMLRKSET
jgi:hypothetical protein